MYRSVRVWGIASTVAAVALAQAVSGQADAQPSGPAPAGDVIGVGNFGHIVSDLDRSLELYHGVLGLEVGMSVDFSVNPGVQAMSGTPGAQSRITVLMVPGLELGVELIEYKDIDRVAQHPRFVDPGAANLALRVRDLDALFPAIKGFPGVTVLTAGGEPATIETPNGRLHAVFVQDPDGFVLELIEGTGPPGGTAGDVVGAAFEATVADSAQTIAFYNGLLGFDFTLGESFNSNQQMAATAGAPGASFRQSSSTMPGTSVPMTLIEFKGVERKRLSGRTQDPGTTVLQLRVRDVAALTAKLEAAGVSIVSDGGVPYEPFPGVKVAIVRDPNNMLLELIESVPQ